MTRAIAALEQAVGEARSVLICDIWGVLHNGVAAFAPAVAALLRMRAAGHVIVLLSNAPRPSPSVRPQLQLLGVPDAAYDAIVTSGDICRSMIAAGGQCGFLHLGPERDRALFDGLEAQPVDEADADFILCTGLFDDTHETPEDYRERFERLAARKLVMLCANPDIVVDRGGIEVYCAGALAELYQSLGGKADVIGKPLAIAYEHAMKAAGALTGEDRLPGLTLAIGDSLRTDIAGARGFGIRSLLIAKGIHAGELMTGDAIAPAKARTLFDHWGLEPDFMMPMLV
jgi:HAD superfamily hydrolase (TIGR01459 family)